MDRVPLNFGQGEEGWGFDQYMNHAVPSTAQEAVDASYDLAKADTAVTLGARYKAHNDLDGQGARKLTPEEANAQYPSQIPYKEPVSPYVAQFNFDQDQEKKALQAKIEAGPQDLWTQTRMFGKGLLAHAMDPLEMGAGYVIGLGVGGAMASQAVAARTGLGAALNAGTKVLSPALGKAAAGRVAGHVIESAAGNLVQSAAQEVLLADVSAKEQQPYSVEEGLFNAAVGTLFGTGLHVAVKEAAPAVRALRNLMRRSPELDAAVLNHGVQRANQGLNPDIGPLIEATAKQTDVRPENFAGKFSYEYAPATPENVKGKKFYIAAESPDVGTARQIGDEIGIGRQMTDHPGIGNAASEGSVIEVDPKNLNMLNLNEPITPEVHDNFARALEGVVDNPDEFLAQASPKDVFNALWEEIDSGRADVSSVEKLQEGLKSKGYNALLDDGRSVMGVEHQPHNLVTLLDENAVEAKGHYATDPEVRNNPSPQEIERVTRANMEEGEPRFTDEASMEVPEARLDPLADVPREVATALEEADLLDKQGILDPELKEEYEVLRGMQAEQDTHWVALKAIAKCMGGL